MSEAGGPRALRLSDVDREQAVNDLKTHAAAGRLSVDEIAEVSLPPDQVRRRVLKHLAPPLARYGYELVDAGADRLTFVLSGRTGAFSLPRSLSIRLTLEPLPEGRTRLLAHGKAPLGVRRGFAGLAQL